MVTDLAMARAFRDGLSIKYVAKKFRVTVARVNRAIRQYLGCRPFNSRKIDNAAKTTQIGEQLRKARQRKGLSLRQLGRKARISFSFIARVERGENDVTARKIKRLCAALGITKFTL